MNLFTKLFKLIQANAHALLKKFEDPVKLAEQGIRDLKGDFDESMKNVAKMKAIVIGAKKDIEVKKQIAVDYEQKALVILKKGQNNELDSQEADRLASAALQKKQAALEEASKLSTDLKSYEQTLSMMEKKVQELKNKIREWETEYQALKARAIVAKTTKKINQQLSTVNADSTTAMLEDMKQRITEEENLAEAYGEAAQLETSIDDEIDRVAGIDYNIQNSLEALKQKLLENPDKTQNDNSSIEDLKKELN